MVDLSRRSAREVLDDHLNLASDWVDTPLDQILDEDLIEDGRIVAQTIHYTLEKR